MTSQDCKNYKIIDKIIAELPGGAHRNKNAQAAIIKKVIIENIEDLKKIPIEELVKKRKKKYLEITSEI